MSSDPALVTTIAQRYRRVQTRIAKAERTAARTAGTVRLIAASKQQSAAAICALATLGHLAFGENYASEAEDKQRELHDLNLEWHFIGHIQSNKTANIARAFSWVHSVDREKIAGRLHAARPSNLPPLNVCLQVNVGDESSKSGIRSDDIAGLQSLARTVAGLPRLRLRGLMAIPPPTSEVAQQRRAFATLRETRARLLQNLGDELGDALPAEDGTSTGDGLLDVLSMGMSCDLEAAISEGATHVRIGSALFGPRPAVGSERRIAGPN